MNERSRDSQPSPGDLERQIDRTRAELALTLSGGIGASLLIVDVVGVLVATVAYADVPAPPPAPASESPAGSGRTPTKVG